MHLVIGMSVLLLVHNSVLLIYKEHYLYFGWVCSKQTWTVSSSKDCSNFSDIACPMGWARVKK